VNILSTLMVAASQASDGLQTRDWLVPAISGAAGVVGALGAQALGRNTLLGVEKLRGNRESRLAEKGRLHDLEGEKRVARGIAAALMKSLEYQRSALEDADRRGQWWSAERTMALHLPRDEQITLASWIGDPVWGIIVAPFMMLTELDAWRAWATETNSAYAVGQFQGTKDAMDLAIGVLKEQIVGVLSPSQPPLPAAEGGP
jgi:hypothetical protein